MAFLTVRIRAAPAGRPRDNLPLPGARALRQSALELVDARDVGGIDSPEQREVEAQGISELHQRCEPCQPARALGADLVHGRALACRVLRDEVQPGGDL